MRGALIQPYPRVPQVHPPAQRRQEEQRVAHFTIFTLVPGPEVLCAWFALLLSTLWVGAVGVGVNGVHTRGCVPTPRNGAGVALPRVGAHVASRPRGQCRTLQLRAARGSP